MTGSLRLLRNGDDDDPYRRAVVKLDNGSDVAYRDVRRFGTWLLLEPGELEPYLATGSASSHSAERSRHDRSSTASRAGARR